MKNRFVLLLLLLVHVLASPVSAQPVHKATSFDAEGRFNVHATVPAGTRHVVLEMAGDQALGGVWRKMLAGTVDGRSADVVFRLPRQGDRCFVRVRAGTEVTPPVVELSDPALVSVIYVPAITERVKVGFLNNAGAKMREWKSLPRAQSQANLIAWALTDPNVVRATVSPVTDNVSIRFSDGDICVLLNRPRSAADAALPTPAATGVPAVNGVASSMAARAAAAAVGDLPGNNKAITAFSLESTFPNSAPTIAGWLGGHGYTVTNHGSTTLGQIMAWSTSADPLGALFWHAHGCSYEKPDGTEGIGIITREYCDPDASHPVYSEMRSNHELMLAKDDSEALPYYGITSKFIRGRMRFAPHSVVVLDACCGAHPDLGNAFLAAGAGSFASWDWLSGPDSGTPCLKVFDRLLGMNQEPPLSFPKERSFALMPVIAWMSQKRYDFDPSPKFADQTRPNARLVWFHNGSAPGHILRPSVMRVLTEARSAGENFTKYLLEGDFGPDPGPQNRSVLWGGQPMQVLRWHAVDGIVIRIPQIPPKGELQVVMSENYYSYSNKVPVTEWTVPFSYQMKDEGSLAATMELNVKFRGDIRGARFMPEMDPQYIGVGFNNMYDCTGTISAAGTHRPEPNITYTWSGGSSLRSVDPNAEGDGVVDRVIWNSGVLQTFNGSIFPFGLAASGPFTSTRREVDTEGNVTTTVGEEDLTLDAFPMMMTQPIAFNPATSALNGGTRRITEDVRTMTLTWPAVTPAFAPSTDTPR